MFLRKMMQETGVASVPGARRGSNGARRRRLLDEAFASDGGARRTSSLRKAQSR
ncbi:hypothetical protein A2U01_0018072, partial [Trifolium medium]|nr:hypothetical protein [Trifolium medium]